MMKARAPLDRASSTSFLTKSLAQRLHLQRRCHSMKVGSISDSATQLSSCGIMDLNISSHGWKTLAVKVVVLPKVATNLSSCQVLFNCRWKHLSNNSLVDPDFGSPGSVDLLLGADVFSCTILHGWSFGSSGSQSAFQTYFGWVLPVDSHTSSHSNWLNSRLSHLFVLSLLFESHLALTSGMLGSPWILERILVNFWQWISISSWDFWFHQNMSGCGAPQHLLYYCWYCVCGSVRLSARLSVRPHEISGTERCIAALLSPA